jgi:hypothetical protein
MATAPGLPRLIKGGFVVLDAAGVVQKIIAFQYNPETLTRRLDGVSGLFPPPPAPPPEPHEIATFTLQLDAADKLAAGDTLTQQNGLLPAIAALELLLYPERAGLVVWVSGAKRILPVQITQLQIVEQAFDATLNPIRADIAVTLTVLKDADLANNSRGKAVWDAHLAVLQQLAAAFPGGTLAALGLTAV